MNRKSTKAYGRRGATSQSALIDWKRVSLDHVRKACAQFDAGVAAPKRHVQSLVLLIGGRRYPAKFIQALAYRAADQITRKARQNAI